MSTRFQYFFIFCQEGPVGQPPFGMPGLGPGIAEIQENLIHFPGVEPLQQMGRIGMDDPDIGDFGLSQLLHGVIAHFPLGLHAQISDFRMELAHGSQELALAAADF